MVNEFGVLTVTRWIIFLISVIDPIDSNIRTMLNWFDIIVFNLSHVCLKWNFTSGQNPMTSNYPKWTQNGLLQTKVVWRHDFAKYFKGRNFCVPKKRRNLGLKLLIFAVFLTNLAEKTFANWSKSLLSFKKKLKIKIQYNKKFRLKYFLFRA